MMALEEKAEDKTAVWDHMTVKMSSVFLKYVKEKRQKGSKMNNLQFLQY